MRKLLVPTGAFVLTVVIGLSTMASAATLFSDDFNDGNANVSGSYQQSGTSAGARALSGTSSWSDYTVQARVRPNAFGSAASRAAGIAARAQSTSNFYSLMLTGTGSVQIRRGSTTLA